MPPLPKNPGPLFTQLELGMGGGMARREVISLKEADPTFVPPGHGCLAVRRLAAIGALRNAGLSLFSAARLFMALRDTDLRGYREVPSRLDEIAGQTLAITVRAASRSPENDDDADYYLHQRLFRHEPSIYTRGVATRGDYIVEIVDWRAVMTYTPRLPKPNLIGWINRQTGRGAEITIATPHYDGKTETELAAQLRQNKAAEDKAVADRSNAVTRVILNLSLAVRNAFDRIEMSRHPSSAEAAASRRNPEDGHE